MAVSIAVASGKGGVGKTTTASNLAVYYAGKGIRVGLIDVDPLSDIAVIFDLPQDLLKGIAQKLDARKGLDSYTVNVFPNLNLLFPVSKTGKKDSRKLYSLLSESFNREINESYDILILDMPAGVQEEDNLNFLKLADHLLLVTNPEPVAHTASGAYIKKALETENLPGIFFWHNKYKGYSEISFDPMDIIGNYNRNMPEEERLDPENLQFQDAAFIPEDKSLDLLQGDPAVVVQVLRNSLNIIDILHEELLLSEDIKADVSDRMMTLIRYYFRTHPVIPDPEEALGNLAAYIAVLSGISVEESRSEEYQLFTSEQRTSLLDFIGSIQTNSLRQQFVKTSRILNQKIAALESEASLFSVPMSHDPGSALDRELSLLLIKLQESKLRQLKTGGGLLLFYFSLFKLLQSDKLLKIIMDFIPRKNGSGERDRYIQIGKLISRDNEYQKSYLNLVKTFLPLISRQVAVASKTFELGDLVFRQEDGTIKKDVYLKLTSSFIHETVNAGLGIIINFTHRPASVIFTRSAENFLKTINFQDTVQP